MAFMEMQEALSVTYDPPKSTRSGDLVEINFNSSRGGLELAHDKIRIDIPGLGHAVREVWSLGQEANPAIEYGGEGPIVWGDTGTSFVCAAQMDDEDVLADRVAQLYRCALDVIKAKGYSHPYRIWNYIGNINAPNSRGLERYRDFCKGRAEGFDTSRTPFNDLPAGTGIGFASGGVTAIFFSSKQGRFFHIENPLQMPAYHYPDQYGPRSPSFARGTIHALSGEAHLFISGTASIRSHETIGSTVDEQLRITFENIETLIENGRLKLIGEGRRIRGGGFESAKIYVRHESDLRRVAARAREHFKLDAEQAPALLSDICRTDLLLEIEGVYKFSLYGN
ncbi:reactive intermediate/imine deaminase [Burkholderia ubonensis]|uniref:chorismate transformation enzyme, FkbO/Hyg5 family n=1 Tax=Burkholderia ubonensis TaxID=101571 RepID=UPI000A495B06|nr:reactive intermediate/imine deaminase [Burkholderia ubonensis]